MTQYIKSVVTKKTIKVGGCSHKRLIKDGLMQSIESAEPTKGHLESDVLTADTSRSVPSKDIKSSDSDVEQLVKSTSKNAMDVFKKIKSGQIALPDDLNDDEKLSNYIQQCLMLNIIKDNKIDKPAKKPKKPKKQYIVTSSDSDGDSSD